MVMMGMFLYVVWVLLTFVIERLHVEKYYRLSTIMYVCACTTVPLNLMSQLLIVIYNYIYIAL